jgi:hypothetical protein
VIRNDNAIEWLREQLLEHYPGTYIPPVVFGSPNLIFHKNFLNNVYANFSASEIVWDFLTTSEEGLLEEKYEGCKIIRKFNSAMPNKTIRKYVLKDEILERTYRQLCRDYAIQKQEEASQAEDLTQNRGYEPELEFQRVNSNEVSPINETKSPANEDAPGQT